MVDTYNQYKCHICCEDVRDDVEDCGGPRHKLFKDKPVEEKQIEASTVISDNDIGYYVNPETGKIVKRTKTLNTPAILGKE
jgi:hypothetical protein